VQTCEGAHREGEAVWVRAVGVGPRDWPWRGSCYVFSMRDAVIASVLCFVGFALATPVVVLAMAALEIERSAGFLVSWWVYGFALSLSAFAIRVLIPVRRPYHSATNHRRSGTP